MNIELKVSPISAKILRSTYNNAEIIIPSRYDYLYTLLKYSDYTDVHLPADVQFSVEVKISVRFKNQYTHISKEAVARLLHQHHLLLFCIYVQSRADLNLEVLDSIKSFFKKYDIDEDDYSQDAAVKFFYRFKEKNVEKLPKKTRKSVLPDGNKRQKGHDHTRRLSQLAIEHIINETAKEFPELVYLKTGAYSKRKRKCLEAFVLKDVCRYQSNVVEKRTGLPERTIRHVVARLRIFFKQKNKSFPI